MKRIIAIFLFVLTGFQLKAQNCDLVCNGDFDNSFITNSMALIDSNILSCWHTTAQDGLMEIWQNGYNGVPAFSGNQFLEINANYTGTVYQNLILKPGSHINISFAHRGRAGTDVMEVFIGETGGSMTSLGLFSDNDVTWGFYNIGYNVPPVQNTNVFQLRFSSVSAAMNLPSIGNFLDAVNVCYETVGINNTEQKESSISYSNNSQLLNVELNKQGMGELFVYNLAGEKMKHTQVVKNHSQFSLSDLNKGMYVAVLYLNDQTIYKTFLITE